LDTEFLPTAPTIAETFCNLVADFTGMASSGIITWQLLLMHQQAFAKNHLLLMLAFGSAPKIEAEASIFGF